MQFIPATLVYFISKAEEMASMACRFLQKLLVLLVIFLFVVFSYSYLNYLFSYEPKTEGRHVPWRNSTDLEKKVYLSIGIFMLYNLVYNYTMAHLVGPGHPENLELRSLHQIKKKCKKCHSPKPVRTHHCSICNKCIMQMDHHCPWLGTCIGHYNRRFFIKFLLYLSLSCFLVVNLILELELPRAEVYLFMWTIGLIIGLFALFHIVIALIGRSTLELCQIFDGYRPSSSWLTNFEIIFGTKNFLLALLPINLSLSYKGCEWDAYERIELTEYEEGSIINVN